MTGGARPTRQWSALIAALPLVAACAAAPTPVTSLRGLNLDAPVLRATTNIERDAKLGRSPDLAGDGPARTSQRADRASLALFWTGVVVGLVGVAGLAAFGASGLRTRQLVDDGYKDGISSSHRSDLSDRGEVVNKLTWTSSIVGLVGASTAAASFAVQYGQCGRLVARTKRCLTRAATSPTAPQSREGPNPSAGDRNSGR